MKKLVALILTLSIVLCSCIAVADVDLSSFKNNSVMEIDVTDDGDA